MSPPITRTSDWVSQSFSMIIDVRSDSEYADDHIPGAVSMPVLNDAERAEVGTMYKQVGAFEANGAVRHWCPAISRSIWKTGWPMHQRILPPLSIAGAAVSGAVQWPAF
jgi:hypothetical protein